MQHWRREQLQLPVTIKRSSYNQSEKNVRVT